MRTAMKILLVTVGSAGDVHPFVGLALRLRQRGHEVRIATNPHFAPLMSGLELPLHPLGTVGQFKAAISNPGLWHPIRGLDVIASLVLDSIAEAYDLVKREAGRGDTLVVSHPLSFGARVAHDALAVPLVTLHLAPAAFWSLEAPAVLDMRVGSIAGWPRIIRRLLLGFADQWADLKLGPTLNKFRAGLGLAPARHIASRWWHSPQRVVGLFPDWYAAPQPDWPPNASLTGFPLYDARSVSDTPPHLDAFLREGESAGESPIAFAPGSENSQARPFFAAAADACCRLGRRGILLSRYPEQFPARLPREVLAAGYAPFSTLLPRVAALVHHAGIGTSAQALAAGCPQLVLPMGFDQPDNAARLVQLGVARAVPPRRVTGARLASEIEQLLGDSAVSRCCAEAERRFQGDDAIGRTCEIIEECAP